MHSPPELIRDLVLVGGGHSHSLVLRMLAMKPVEGLRVTLISPSSHTPYSGMLPGLVAGHYGFEDTHIDLARLCQWAGVRFIAAEVTSLDRVAQTVTMAHRPDIAYDLISLDIGSQPELASVPGAADHAIPVKPVASLWRRWQLLERQLEDSTNRPRIAVVGGGAGSVELALAMSHRLRNRAKIELFCGGQEILSGYNRRARATVEKALVQAGVALHRGARVSRVERHRLVFTARDPASFTHLFWCTGASPARWIADSGLALDSAGFVAVNAYLQSTGDERVFAAGDIATQVHDPRPKAGVYAVRQAPVLAHNLIAALAGRPFKSYRPQRRFLSLLSLGGRRAVADRGPFSASGAWVWHWKDRIDRAFMAKFSALPATMGVARARRLDIRPVANEQAACGGCGAKVGGDALAVALDQLVSAYPRLVATVHDDAALVEYEGSGLMQSVDVLRQLVGDPFLMGRIAANHALSDLYACGARPVSALATITLPFASSELLQRELVQILSGALEAFAAVDCRLIGGHSMQGPELQLGFTGNGVLTKGQRLMAKVSGRPGDALLLTKPLGTGVLFAAQMQLVADGRHIQSALNSMLLSNYTASQLARSAGATACTDVTGFGLAGHLLEMLPEGLAARLKADAIPVLPGARRYLQAGVRSSMHEKNLASYGSRVAVESAAAGAADSLLYDPQTSGGLLVAVAPEEAAALCESIQQSGSAQAAVIGELLPASVATQKITLA